MNEIRVISADMDGTELRRERQKNRRHIRCDGKADDGEIQEAINGVGKTMWSGLGEAWERIFGGKK